MALKGVLSKRKKILKVPYQRVLFKAKIKLY